MIHTPTLIFNYLGLGGVQFVAVSMITWLPTFLNRTSGIPIDQAGLRATSSGLYIIFTSLFGSLGPVVIGAISDASGIETSMKVLPVFLISAAALFIIGLFFYEGLQ